MTQWHFIYHLTVWSIKFQASPLDIDGLTHTYVIMRSVGSKLNCRMLLKNRLKIMVNLWYVKYNSRRPSYPRKVALAMSILYAVMKTWPYVINSCEYWALLIKKTNLVCDIPEILAYFGQSCFIYGWARYQPIREVTHVTHFLLAWDFIQP